MSDYTTLRKPCPVCGKDGCSYTDDRTAIMCRRISDGSVKPIGSWAWLHRLEDRPEQLRTPAPSVRRERPPLPEAGHIARTCYAALSSSHRDQLANQLGLRYESIRDLGVGWHSREQAFTFPMRMGNGKICGIRLRSRGGHKWAIKGSRAGLFIPRGRVQMTLWICEGPTDTAALHGLGFFAVGRDSCTGGREDLEQFIGRTRPRRVVIVADRDEPGQRGAAALRQHLGKGMIVTPPAKDVRQWVREGATDRDLIGLINRKEVAA